MIGLGGHKRVPFSFYKPSQIHDLSLSIYQKVVKEIANVFAAQGIKIKQLNVSHAFHSPLLNPILVDLKNVLNKIKFNKPSVMLISNLTGKVVEESKIMQPQY